MMHSQAQGLVLPGTPRAYQAVPIDDQGIFARNGFEHRGELGGEFLLVGKAIAHRTRCIHHLLPGFPEERGSTGFYLRALS